MKILLLSPELFLADGGIARIMRLYLKAACEICGENGRVDSLVLNDSSPADPRLARYSNARLRHHVACAGSKVRFITQTIRLARDADILICGHLHHLAIARLAKIVNPRLRYCLVAHGIEIWRPYRWLEQRALLGAHRIFSVSDYTRRQILRFLPRLPAARISVVPNTLDPAFSENLQVSPLASIYLAPRILTVARLTTADNYKGIDTLIEALPHIKKVYPFVHLRIVGQGDDVSRLRSLADTLGVAKAVDFVGQIDDELLRSEYAACDLFALPSRKEGFGLVFLEAMTHGKPCVGARAGGVPEVINESVGQLVEYGDIRALAAAVDDLMRHPRDSRIVRDHAASFSFPAFQQRLAAALP